MKLEELFDLGGYFSKPFILCLVISTVIIFTCVIIGSFRGVNVSMEEANAFSNETESEVASLTWFGIFINNFAIVSLPALIPIYGVIWMGAIQYNSGFLLGELSKATGIDNVLYLSALVTDPVGVLEFLAYILICAESLLFVYLAYKREVVKRVKDHTWKTILLVAVLLLIGAVVEAFTLGRL
jgi:uncharacterized membrane protein SpoIIM required for sporulation